jgi:hypothetical protein
VRVEEDEEEGTLGIVSLSIFIEMHSTRWVFPNKYWN